MRITVVAAALSLATAAHAAVDVQGPATVIDSNTLEVQGTRMRLWGLEAPTDEWCTTRKGGCGERARKALEKLVEGERVWCAQFKIDKDPVSIAGTPAVGCVLIKRRGRVEHPILTGSDQSVNVLYAKEGWAAAFTWRYYGGEVEEAIVKAGDQARKRKRGMWRYELTIPENAAYRTLNPAWVPPKSLTIRGIARSVTAGDELVVDGRQIRLAGIEAAQDQWCRAEGWAFESRKALAGLLGKDRRVACAPVAWDTRDGAGATMAMCTTRDPGRGEYCDARECWLNWNQVVNGNAIARREQMFNHPMVVVMSRSEDHAIRAKLGMWKEGVDTSRIVDETMQALPWQEAGEKVTFRGKAEVLGADLLRIGDQAFKLYGAIGAMREWCKTRKNRDCDSEGKAALERMVNGKTVECTQTSMARYFDGSERVLCTARGEEGKGCSGIKCTLSWRMLREGWATWIVYARSRNKTRLVHDLIRAEEAARDERKGMWRGRVQIPRSLERYRGFP